MPPLIFRVESIFEGILSIWSSGILLLRHFIILRAAYRCHFNLMATTYSNILSFTFVVFPSKTSWGRFLAHWNVLAPLLCEDIPSNVCFWQITSGANQRFGFCSTYQLGHDCKPSKNDRGHQNKKNKLLPTFWPHLDQKLFINPKLLACIWWCTDAYNVLKSRILLKSRQATENEIFASKLQCTRR